MPFRSRSQARACFAGLIPGMNCLKWLKETPVRIECLPERVGMSSSKKENCRGKHQTKGIKRGSRGGRYKMVDSVKVYVK